MSDNVRDGDGAGDPLSPLSDLARAWADDSPAHPGGAAAWAELDAGLARQTRHRRTRWALAGTVAIALGTVAGRSLWHRSERLTYAVEGAEARTDGYIPRVVEPMARVRFSDGSEVGLERGSRAWVVDTGAHGAQLRLEDGRAHFSVVHRPQAHWSVEAGPFVVSVTGTKFDVEWSGTDDLLRVHLRSGVVTVGGPQTRGGVTLLPGQVLEARPDQGILRVEPAPADSTATAPAVEPTAPALAPAAPAPTATAPSASTGAEKALSPAAPFAIPSPATAPPVTSPPPVTVGEPGGPATERGTRATVSRSRALALLDDSLTRRDLGRDWRDQIARGSFDRILEEADVRGIGICLRTLPSDRLAALGDAARYAGRRDLARRVLQTQRTRFAGSAAASEATFLLGRLAEDAHQPGSAALPWYQLYLEQAPSGVYAAEALGREMLILGERENDSKAREVAHKYLDAYPRGAYVTQARDILDGAP